MGENDHNVKGRRRSVVASLGLVMSVALLVSSLATTAGAATVDAGFDISGDRVAGSPISFVDRSSGSPKWVYWTFGDGNSARSANSTHTYRAAGTYEVRYVVCVTSTDCDTERRTIAVTNPATTSPARPDVRFTTSGTLVAGSPVTFTDQTAGPIGWVYWAFDDGSSSRERGSVTHTFAEPGTYDVRYFVCAAVDRCGGQVQSVTIGASDGSTGGGPADLMSDFSYSGLSDELPVTAGTRVEFNDRSTGIVRGVYWTFGDGAASRQADTSHTYTDAGRYRVRYTVCTNPGRCDTKTRWIEVTSPDGSASPPSTGDSAPVDPGAGSGVSATSTVLGAPAINHGSDMVWSPDSSLLAIARFDTNWNEIQVWDRSDPARSVARFVAGDGVSDLSWSPDSRRLASDGGGVTRIWSLDDPADVIVLETTTRFTGSVAWSPDGTRVVTAGAGAARVWDLSRPDSPEALLAHRTNSSWAKWSRDGSRLLTRGSSGELRVWNPDDWSEPIATMRDPASLIFDAEFSPDATRVASESSDHVVRVWDVASPSIPTELRGHAGVIRSIDWSPDGSRVVTASRDRTIRVWDPANPTNPQVLTGHTESVAAVRWSPDGSVLASASDDATVRLWDLTNPANPTVLTGHTADIDDLHWSPDGTQFATSSSDDNTARLWTID